MQSYFAFPKSIRLNSTHYFIMIIPNKRALQHIAFNYLLNIEFQDFMKTQKECTEKPYYLFDY